MKKNVKDGLNLDLFKEKGVKEFSFEIE